MHELTFLPLSLRKGIDLPKVIIEEYCSQNYGGYYDTTSNVIVAVDREAEGSSTLATVLAHEFRHFLQYRYTEKVTLKNSGEFFNQQFEKLSYNKFIRAYFRNIDSEYDALLFQHKYAKAPITEFWLKALVNPKSIKDIDSIYIQ
jgi:hypothetical protein